AWGGGLGRRVGVSSARGGMAAWGRWAAGARPRGGRRRRSCSASTAGRHEGVVRLGRVAGRANKWRILDRVVMGTSGNGVEQGRKPSAPRADRTSGRFRRPPSRGAGAGGGCGTARKNPTGR